MKICIFTLKITACLFCLMKYFLRFFLVISLFCPVLLKGQDAHYWSSNFSPAGFLTPGAAIANTLDSGVVYLNPAVMAWSNKTATSISSNIYRFERINIKNAVGEKKSLNANNTKIVPQIASKTFKLNKEDPLTIGIALIQNPMQDFTASQRSDKIANVLDDNYSPGAESFIGQINGQSKVTETYAQISAGKRLTDRLAVGITAEGTLRKVFLSNRLTSRALYNTKSDPDIAFPPIARNEAFSQIEYTHVGLRFKFGLAYDYGKHHAGLLISSPLAKLYSKGTYISDVDFSNLVIEGTTFNLLASTRQTGLKATWKMPLSIAGGYAYDYDKGQIYIAAEFFNSLNPYSILKPDDADFVKTGTAPTGANTGSLNVLDDRKSVLNIGIGYSRKMNDVFTLMSSIRTDFNYLNTKTSEDGHIALWDNYHAQIGGNFKRRKFNLRAGILFSYGRTGNYVQPANFDNASDQNFLTGVPGTVPARHFGTGLLLAYVHNF